MGDTVTRRLAAFAADACADESAARAAQRLLTDALGAALTGTDHAAAEIGRRYAADLAHPGGCVVWGSDLRVDAQAAALANGILLRAYDFNDLHRGAQQGGHPSDMFAGLVAAAECEQASGADFVTAVRIAYDVSFVLMDTFCLGKRGWDYTNLTAIGATCAIGRLFGLTAAEIEEAISITISAHVATNATESSELDRDGELTLWKRFNGADAMRHALYAATLARCGARGPVRPFEGPMGLLPTVFRDETPDLGPLDRLAASPQASRLAEVSMKRWPVGSKAQSAIRAAVQVAADLSDPSPIESVLVEVDSASFDHLVRAEAVNPQTRSQADHSLPFIVAAALADGAITTASFAQHKLRSPAILALLAKTVVRPSDQLTAGFEAGYPARVSVTLADGTMHDSGEVRAAGSERDPLSDADLRHKLLAAAAPALGEERAEALVRHIDKLPTLSDVGLLTATLASPVHNLNGERHA